jgi:hypothetical protein
VGLTGDTDVWRRSNALACLGKAADTAVLVLCGKEDCSLFEGALARREFGDIQVIGGPATTRRHVTIIDPTSRAAVTHVQVLTSPPQPAA